MESLREFPDNSSDVEDSWSSSSPSKWYGCRDSPWEFTSLNE